MEAGGGGKKVLPRKKEAWSGKQRPSANGGWKRPNQKKGLKGSQEANKHAQKQDGQRGRLRVDLVPEAPG